MTILAIFAFTLRSSHWRPSSDDLLYSSFTGKMRLRYEEVALGWSRCEMWLWQKTWAIGSTRQRLRMLQLGRAQVQIQFARRPAFVQDTCSLVPRPLPFRLLSSLLGRQLASLDVVSH